ncbi:MAG: hypothetical protein JO218_12370 [Burkholderiales bacterium]|nr:hypothetical protein [Burkholderiales bacterium]
MKIAKHAPSQWALWSPALVGVLALGLAGGLAHKLDAPPWLQLTYLVLAIVLLWWIAPRVAYRIWCDGANLYWRWGLVHHEGVRSVQLADIVGVEVVALPDAPRRYVRTVNGVEVHGGNFTPALNYGVAIALRDGRRLCFGLPEPDKFATALRLALPAPILGAIEADSP